MLYVGYRDANHNVRVVKREGGEEAELCMRFDERRHSPTGFEWGYGGSGPAQLAYALLRDRLPDCQETVDELYHTFKFQVIAGLPKAGWVIDAYDIDQWIWREMEKIRWTNKVA